MQNSFACRLKRLQLRPKADRAAHIGVHAQKQKGLNWVGVVLPVGKLTGDQMRGLATVARDLGDGDVRLTVWQNLLISGVPADKVALAEAAIEALGLATKASAIRTGLVACTGNTGCRFAASDTKGHAEQIARWCEARVELDTPVNIHLTGCHHSCAQHYIGDIGLLACKVPVVGRATPSRAITSWSAADSGPDATLARELFRDVKADDAPHDHRSACSRPIFRGAPRTTRRSTPSPSATTIAALGTLFAECRS